jgi:hypothetical protein
MTAEEDEIEFREFLTARPPGTSARIDRGACKDPHISNNFIVAQPELMLYCDGECKIVTHCNGRTIAKGRLFGAAKGEPSWPPSASSGPPKLPYDVVILYACEKCRTWVKSYSLRFWTIAPSLDTVGLAEVEKVAEWPAFAPRTPGKVTSLIGPDRDLFLKGRRAEIEGLGIGAFSYYRLIIETQKNRLLDEIIRVARHVSAPADALNALESAKRETQFSRAVDSVKEAIPPALYIKGHNPLTLLHSALSQGLHGDTDEACLRAASDIRLILIELADRLTEAMKEQRDLDEALTRLVNRKS